MVPINCHKASTKGGGERRARVWLVTKKMEWHRGLNNGAVVSDTFPRGAPPKMARRGRMRREKVFAGDG